MQVKDKNITVVGLGITGQALIAFLHERGARITAVDQRRESELGGIAVQLRTMGVRLELGPQSVAGFETTDLIVVSPGVPHTIESLDRARKSGVPVTGEVELASRFIHTPMVAVTGTNGKSTVTRMIGNMLEASGLRAFVGGNLGTPLISYARGPMAADVVVAEISSFQLDTAETFHPEVGVLLNITADHLDRYPDLRAYGASKAKLLTCQSETDTAVLNRGDALVMELAQSAAAQKCLFNASADTDCAAWIEAKDVCLKTPGTGKKRISGKNIPLAGRHNLENAAAAALAALAAGARFDGVVEGLQKFIADPHRLQWVGRIRAVDYYDDSKATNVNAVVRAVEAVRAPVVLILGGRDKGGGYNGLAPVVKSRVTALVLLGEAGDAINRELGGMVETRRAGTMDEAVALASQMAEAGGTVLLSPACSSFDMYENYARRGEDFQRAVSRMEKSRYGSQTNNP